MTDLRPVVHCTRCRQEVVSQPNGRCPWCDKTLKQPSTNLLPVPEPSSRRRSP